MYSIGYGHSSQRNRVDLPVDKYKDAIIYHLERQRILIVLGETGSGKSTRIPQILYQTGKFNGSTEVDDEGDQVICVTQPRRVAAIQLAQRVSQDLNCNLGTVVGYAIRFDEAYDPKRTKIKYVTEGLLLREMMVDPLLSKYSVIMIDEVHERNLNTDIILGLLKCIMLKRDDLRLILSSATAQVEAFKTFFNYPTDLADLTLGLERLNVVSVEGKTYPVKIYYRKEPVSNYLDASVETVINIHETSRLASGKILIFLSGQDEVTYVVDRLKDYAQASLSRLDLKKLCIIALHASMKPEEISRVFENCGRNTRMCIVSTNIAETSITIDDVAFVIDSGFAKFKIYDHSTGIDALVKMPISKSSAKQRSGRAGRTRNGVVYRLYSEDEYKKLNDDTMSESERSSLGETIMLLKSLGVENPCKFSMLTPFRLPNMISALELLYTIGAIDDKGNLTKEGNVMAELNLDPKLAKILVSTISSPCSADVCKIVSMLQVKEIYNKAGARASNLWSNVSLTSLCVSEGDLLSYLNIFNAFVRNDRNQRWAEKRNLNYQALMNATEIHKKLQSQLRRAGFPVGSSSNRIETIQRALITGLFSNAAYMQSNGDYKTIRGNREIHVHPMSVLGQLLDRPKYVVFVEILHTNKCYMRHIMAIEPGWLLDLAPHFYSYGTQSEVRSRGLKRQT